MNMAIGRWPFRKSYQLNTSLVTLLRYRSAFGVSFFSDFFNGDAYIYLLRLSWASIEGKRPDFAKFIRLAAKTRGFFEAAQELQSLVLMTSGKKRESDKAAEVVDDFDELDILSMMAVSGVSMDLSRELPAFLILDVISKRTELMRGSCRENAPKRFRKMSGTEIRKLYGG